MLLAPTTGVFLQPARPGIPYRTILDRWLQAGFAPRPCREALEEIIASHRLSPALFDPPAIERGGLAATDALLFDSYARAGSFRLVIMHGRTRALRRPCDAAEVPVLAALLRAAAQEEDAAALRARFSADAGPEVLDALLAPAPEGSAPPPWPRADRPGIYRREHASLLVRSREAAVLVDPLRLAPGYFPEALSRAPRDLGAPALDAVCITHTHDDHWHLPSVLQHADAARTLVIVPRVPRPCLLAPEDPLQALQLAGQRAAAPAWGETLQVGDLAIDVLPFYGEQPVRLPPGPPAGLRNWGSCYRFRAPDFSALVLVDSGADPQGDMVRVVRRSAAEHGPADALLCCVQEFPSPFFGGVANECLALPFSRLQELWSDLCAGRLPSATAGPAGAAQLCQEAGARYFLPYANGFAALGTDNGVDWGAGPSEAAVVGHIAGLLRARGAATQARPWNPGDAALFSEGKLALRPFAAA